MSCVSSSTDSINRYLSVFLNTLIYTEWRSAEVPRWSAWQYVFRIILKWSWKAYVVSVITGPPSLSHYTWGLLQSVARDNSVFAELLLSSLLSPLCRVFTVVYLKQTVSMVYSVAAVLYLQFVFHVMLFRLWNMFLYIYISTFCSMCAVPYMAVFSVP